jgi:hypothetical protein
MLTPDRAPPLYEGDDSNPNTPLAGRRFGQAPIPVAPHSLNSNNQLARARCRIKRGKFVTGSRTMLTRRTFTAVGTGFVAGLFAARMPGAFAQDGTPVAMTPSGYVSARLRTLKTAADRPEVNALVLKDFAPKVQLLDGYGGYLLGDVIDQATQSITVVALDREDQGAGFNALAKTFVAGLTDKVDDAATKSWAGDLLMWGAPKAGAATPEASSVASPAAGAGFIAFRVFTSLPGANPRDFVPAAIAGFLPIVTGLPGFKGYLWFPTDAGFVSISTFDSIESAQASNVAAKDWATKNLKLYTDGNPMIINANTVFEDLPIVRRLPAL